MGLIENYKNVLENIEIACEKAGRKKEEITLIAVSKFKPVSDIKELFSIGQKCFGENHVQEIIKKKEEFPEADYHMIGHLQTNKVKQVLGRVSLIQSVDTYRLASEISKEAKKKGLTAEILIEINAGNEESKYGFSFEEAKKEIREIAKLPNIKIKGLMCIAPFTENPENNRPVFKKMKDLYVDIMSEKSDNIEMKVLSMGMTNDYRVAIEEGATMIRVGTAVFGARNTNI